MSQHSSEAAIQTKRQFEDYRNSSNRLSSTSLHHTNESASTNGRQPGEDSATDREQSRSSSESPPPLHPNSRDSPKRRQRTNGVAVPTQGSSGPLIQDRPLAWAEPSQNGMHSTDTSSMQLSHDLHLDSFPGSAFDGYNPADDQPFMMDDRSFDMNLAMSSYIDTDPADANMFQSQLLLTDPLPSLMTETGALPGTKTNAHSSWPTTPSQETISSDFEGWPCFVCNSSSVEKVHPKTGRLFLEGLEHTLKDHDSVLSSKLLLGINVKERVPNAEISIEPFSGRARDKLMVITQSILHRARKVHGSSVQETNNNSHHPDTPTSYEPFSILPSAEDLQHLLQSYANRFEPFYPFVPARLLSPNAILESTEGRCSSLLLLLMFAQGAMATPTNEARYFTSGLAEACRLSWFSLVEKDVALTRDPISLRSALMFMNLAAWSGNKWHMDVSVPHRLSTLKAKRVQACCWTVRLVHIRQY